MINALNWGSVLGLLRGTQNTALDQDRFANYTRYQRAYDGYKTPSLGNPSRSQATEALRHSRLRYNFNRPIVEIGAAFLAGGALKWDIDPEGESESDRNRAQQATDQANAIWDRSGSDRLLLEAARRCGIDGDIVGISTQTDGGRAKIEFAAADLCFPVFAGSDNQKLQALTIAWEEEDLGRAVRHREEFTPEGRIRYVDNEETEAQAFDGFIPCTWIRNVGLKGRPFGYSDLDGVTELVEQYDHVMGKRERIIDYYASPSICFKGVTESDIAKNTQTMFFLPADGDVVFLEWKGTAPDIEQQLDRIRNDIAEVSQVPAVAFGRQDSGLSQISGVALRILYGPLVAKTAAKRASWSPGLEYLMWLCLRAEGLEVPIEAVNVRWPDPVPVNAKELAETEKIAVDSGLTSRRSAMQRLGVEDAEEEYASWQEENRLKTLGEGVKAGLSLHAAALEAGVPEEELPGLLRTDMVDGIRQ